MNVQRMQAALWVVFVAFSLLGPACAALGFSTTAVPHPLGIAFGIAALIIWWGAFGYAMYLSMAAVKNGDKRLLARGIKGTAVIERSKVTGEIIQTGGYEWESPRVIKYWLEVTLPGKKPYKTTCSVCCDEFQQGQVVQVAASRWNPKRVAIDLGQLAAAGKAMRAGGVSFGGIGTDPTYSMDADPQLRGPGSSHGTTITLGGAGGQVVIPNLDQLEAAAEHLGRNVQAGRDALDGVDLGTFGGAHVVVDGQEVGDHRGGGGSSETERVAALSKLADLHHSGALTDQEFAAEKARLIGTGPGPADPSDPPPLPSS